MSSSTLPQVPLLFLLFISLSLLFAFVAPYTDTPTAYELLESYDFPVGILPKGVTGYELNPDTGEFKLYLPQTCKFSIQGYDLEYKSTISGVVSKDRITKLKGISVRIFIIWLSITEVDNKNGQLQFSVGIASANFPLDGFEESPTCGCGFDCNGANHLISTLVSSS
ncbi:hypothetical protein BVRB_7g163620 [Beta vulgaris subsp. vulgaris]|nr:hypothetical protein BVRB_7g163620 [Beta vulgaris subsp. vulgaris]